MYQEQQSQTNNDKEEEINKLNQEINNLYLEAKQLSISQDQPWSEKILILAEKLERRYIIFDQEWLVDNISEEITRQFHNDGIKIWPYVSEFLPVKYKNQNKNNSNSLNTNTSSYYSTSILQGEPVKVLEQLKSVVNNTNLIPRPLVADFENLFKSGEKKVQKRAEAEHIALYPDENASKIDQTNDSKQGDKEKVSIDKPKPHGSLLHEAIGRTIQAFQYIQSRVFEFPPEILDKSKEYADGFDTFTSLFNPALDLKYSKNWLDWFIAERYRDYYGRHAAGVLSFSVTNLCAACSDENTKEWIRMEPVYDKNYESYACFQCGYKIDSVCPSCNLSMKLTNKDVVGWQCSNCGGTVPLQRELTREQVGDKSSIVMDAAIKVVEHIPLLMSFCAWFRDWIDPKVGSRKIRLADDLSERA